MKNFIRQDSPIPLAAPAGGVVSGNGYLIGDLFGVAQNTAAEGALFQLVTEGCITLPKKADDVVTAGAALYWSTANANVTVTVGSNKKIGHAIAAAAGPAATVDVRLITV